MNSCWFRVERVVNTLNGCGCESEIRAWVHGIVGLVEDNKDSSKLIAHLVRQAGFCLTHPDPSEPF